VSIAAAIAGALVAASVTAGLVYERLGRRRDRRRLPPPGRLVDIGDARLHARVVGAGRPAVLLESGLAASSINWTRVQDLLGATTTVVAYDRAGFAWSDRARAPRTGARLADELHRLLRALDLEPPYVLVGHSYGGLLVRSFYRRYPSEVAGLVFVDTTFPHEWLRMSPERRRLVQGGVLFARIGAVLASLGLVRFLLARLARGAPGAPRLVLSLFGPTATHVITRIVGEVQKMPAALQPAIQAHWSHAKSFTSLAGHLAQLAATAADAAAVSDFDDRPLAVIAAGGLRPDLYEHHARLAATSSRGRLVVARTVGHWVHLDDPDLVVEVIRDVVQQARGTSVGAGGGDPGLVRS
jgi:pimeloyl-ACP methyl ester carboxylesterase